MFGLTRESRARKKIQHYKDRYREECTQSSEDGRKLRCEHDVYVNKINLTHREKLNVLTKKLQQVQLDHTLEICPLGTKLKHIGLSLTVTRIEVSQAGDVTVIGEYNKDDSAVELELSLELVKTLKP